MLFDANVGDLVGQFSPQVTSTTVLESVAADTNNLNGGARVIALSSSLFIFVWFDSARTTLKLQAGTVDANGTWTLGTIVSVTKSNDRQFNIKFVSATKFIVSCQTSTTKTKFITYIVSGTTIAQDAIISTFTIVSATCNVGLHVFSATRACFVYENGTGTYVIKGLQIGTGTLVADSFTLNTSAATTASTALPQFFPIDSTRAGLVYGNGLNTTVSCIVTDNGSGAALTFANTQDCGTFDSNTGDRLIGVAADSSLSTVIAYRQGNGGLFAEFATGTYTTSAITWDYTTGGNSYSPLVVSDLKYLRTIGTKSYFMLGSTRVTKTNKPAVILLEFNSATGLWRQSYPFSITNGVGTQIASCSIAVVSDSRIVVFYMNSTSYPSVAVLSF